MPGGAGAADLPAFHERAAIAEHDGELSRDDAEALAAREQGFADAESVYRASVDRWTCEIDRLLRLGARNREAAEALARARAFIRDGWALQAARLGWDELDLFGVSPGASPRCLDGAAFGGAVQAVTEDAIVRVGGPRFYRPEMKRESAVAIWETGA